MQKLFLSKKVIVSIIGLVVSVLVAAGVHLPNGIDQLLLEVIGGVVASFNVGQGLADGLSKGRTSASADAGE